MASESVRHDHAWAGAKSVLAVFAPLLREEEEPEAFAEVYARLRALLECYDIQTDRMLRRMKPGRN